AARLAELRLGDELLAVRLRRGRLGLRPRLERRGEVTRLGLEPDRRAGERRIGERRVAVRLRRILPGVRIGLALLQRDAREREKSLGEQTHRRTSASS